MNHSEFSHFFHPIYRLKELFRQGWVGKVPSTEIESVADHSYAVSLIALVLVPIENELRNKSSLNLKSLNKQIVIEKALVHDLPESGYLDLDKSFTNIIDDTEFKTIKSKLDNNSEQFLHNNFQVMLKSIFSLDNSQILPDMNSKKTEEDEFVKLVDSLELFLQTTSYLDKNFISESQAKQFLESTMEHIRSYSKKFLIVPYLLG